MDFHKAPPGAGACRGRPAGKAMTSTLRVPGFTPQALLHASAFPHPIGTLRLRETHMSWVILTGPFAYKIKKPVKLPFVDCSLLEHRRVLCEEELRLNRRLAPSLYLDVAAITWSHGEFRVGGEGPTVEYAVRMEEFDRTEELESLLTDGRARPEELRDFAGEIAEFHARAPIAPPTPHDRYADRFRSAVLGNVATLLGAAHATADVGNLGRLIDWVHDAVHDAMPLLRIREDEGWIRECHGDLHARNIVRRTGRLIAFDCLEFDPALRWIDVMDDAAFLFMDLLSHERFDLAYGFLNRYLEATGDHAGLELMPLYAVHRALVRAMVDAVSAEAGQTEDFRARMRHRIDAAVRMASRPPPRLVMMHGTSGSGKSWLSRQLTLPLRAIHLCSDVERRRHMSDRPAPERYTPAARQQVYARLESAAASCLRGGFSVIVDATFLTRGHRRPFQQAAAQLGLECVVVACNTDLDTQRRRLAIRRASGNDPSEADADVLERQLQSVEAPDAAEGVRCVTADTREADVAHRTLAAIDTLG
jgi:aminoglycoside phosphotransferase family enzyme/predicted kinase